MNLHPKQGDYIDIHTHHTETGEPVFSIRNVFHSDYPEVPGNTAFSIGLHPWHLSSESNTSTWNILQEAVKHPYLAAIGETGLDKAIKTPLEIQEERFRLHVKASEEHNLPLIIHCVKAYNEIILLKRKLNPSSPWIIHGYHGSGQLTGDLVQEGFYLSLNEWIIKNPEQGKKMLKEIPPDRLFLETDEYTLPVSRLYQFISGCYGIPLDNFKEIIFGNFMKVF